MLFVPSDMQCFWCNGRATEKGVTKMGSGVNHVTYWCRDCGGVMHFAINDENRIKSFDVKYHFEKEEAEDAK